MDVTIKKKLKEQYNEREIVGGVYVVKNMHSGKILLGTAKNLQGVKNRFEFSQLTGSCVDLKLQKDWKEQGGGQFVFEVLEELKKVETQSEKEFDDDISVLKEIWLEKLNGSDFY